MGDTETWHYLRHERVYGLIIVTITTINHDNNDLDIPDFGGGSDVLPDPPGNTKAQAHRAARRGNAPCEVRSR